MSDYEIVALDPATADRALPTPAETAAVREIRYHTRGWMPEDLDTLRRMIGAGVAWEEIAAAFDRRVETVKNKASELGLYRPRRNPWTEDEDRLLITDYGTVPTSTLAIQLDRSAPSVYLRASFLGLTQAAPPPWSAEEDMLLRAVFTTDATIAEIAARLGRPGSGVVSRASRLGLRRPNGPNRWTQAEQTRALELAENGHAYPRIRTMLAAEGFPLRAKSSFQSFVRSTGYSRGWGRPWIEEESDLLRVAYRDGSNLMQLAHRLGRSHHSLRSKAEELGLRGTHPQPNGARQGRPWSVDDDAILTANYGKGRMKTTDLAIRLDRPKAAVYNRAFMLGLDHGFIRDWTTEDDQIIRAAHASGISITDLAHALDRDPTVISKRAVFLGIPFASRPRQAPRTPRANRAPITHAHLLALVKQTTK